MSMLDRIRSNDKSKNDKPETSSEKQPTEETSINIPSNQNTAENPTSPTTDTIAKLESNEEASPAETNMDATVSENTEKSQPKVNVPKFVAPPVMDDTERRQKRIFLDSVIRIHKKLINDSDLDINESDLLTADERELEHIKGKVRQSISKLIDEGNYATSRNERNKLIEAILDETLGLGPIEALIKNDDITEIMVNGPDQIYVELKGKLVQAPVIFHNDHHVRRIIEKIVGLVGRRIDEGMPMVDARLKDGSRVNAIIPPISLVGCVLTIRKFSEIPFTDEDLVNRFGSMSEQMRDFLRSCVKARLNMIISGGTGSGKTTLLNVISSFIPEDERILTIEDSAELQLLQEHVITLESRPANIEGKGAVTIRDLVKNSLRMRPERIVVGEVRGGESLDMLQAMNTGHDGSMTTGHANSPRDMISRLETMVLMAGMDLPPQAIRQQIASAFDLIIQQSRLPDGTRKVTKVTEVVGMEGDTVTLQDVFIFDKQGVDSETGKVLGEFKPTGIRPKFTKKMEEQGVETSWEMFMEGEEVFKRFKF